MNKYKLDKTYWQILQAENSLKHSRAHANKCEVCKRMTKFWTQRIKDLQKGGDYK